MGVTWPPSNFFFFLCFGILYFAQREMRRKGVSLLPVFSGLLTFLSFSRPSFFQGQWYIFTLQFRSTVYSCCEYYSRLPVYGFKFIFFWAPYESHSGLALSWCIKHFSFPLFSLGSQVSLVYTGGYLRIPCFSYLLLENLENHDFLASRSCQKLLNLNVCVFQQFKLQTLLNIILCPKKLSDVFSNDTLFSKLCASHLLNKLFLRLSIFICFWNMDVVLSL